MILVLKTVFPGVTGHESAFRWTWLIVLVKQGEQEPPTSSPNVSASSLTSQVVFDSSSLPGGGKKPGQQETMRTFPR